MIPYSRCSTSGGSNGSPAPSRVSTTTSIDGSGSGNASISDAAGESTTMTCLSDLMSDLRQRRNLLLEQQLHQQQQLPLQLSMQQPYLYGNRVCAANQDNTDSINSSNQQRHLDAVSTQHLQLQVLQQQEQQWQPSAFLQQRQNVCSSNFNTQQGGSSDLMHLQQLTSFQQGRLEQHLPPPPETEAPSIAVPAATQEEDKDAVWVSTSSSNSQRQHNQNRLSTGCRSIRNASAPAATAVLVGSSRFHEFSQPLQQQRFIQRPISGASSASSCAKQEQQQQEREPKKQRLLSDALLHNSCKLFSKVPFIIESALQFDPEAIRCPVPTVCYGQQHFANSNATTNGIKKRAAKSVAATHDDESSSSRQLPHHERPETYKYAINIALKHDATPDVLGLLVAAGPDVLTEPDGPNGAGSLSIALASSIGVGAAGNSYNEDERNDTTWTDQVVSLLLAANPDSAAIVDRHRNGPMHYAARAPHVSLKTISHIVSAFPEALNQRNFHGQTPLQVAQRSNCTEQVLDHLQMLAYSVQEQDLERNLDIIDDVLNPLDDKER